MTARKAWAAVVAKKAGKRPRTAPEARKGVLAHGEQSQGRKIAPRSKYGAVRSGKYASKREAKRAAELRLLQRAGKIFDLQEQVAYELVPKQEGERALTYVADFTYGENHIDEKGLRCYLPVVEDVKGFKTAEYRIKRKLMLWLRGIRIRETG